jgi:hypothetical protein
MFTIAAGACRPKGLITSEGLENVGLSQRQSGLLGCVIEGYHEVFDLTDSRHESKLLCDIGPSEIGPAYLITPK